MSYNRGKNRLFYQSKLTDEQDVKVNILNPKLELSNQIPMIFLGDGLYYVDVWFRNAGSHFVKVYENGNIKHKDILKVVHVGHIIYPDIERLV